MDLPVSIAALIFVFLGRRSLCLLLGLGTLHKDDSLLAGLCGLAATEDDAADGEDEAERTRQIMRMMIPVATPEAASSAASE